MGEVGFGDPPFERFEMLDRAGAVALGSRGLDGQLLALAQGFADEVVGAAHPLLEALEVVGGLAQGARQGLLRMFGTGTNELEQAHALIGQLRNALTARVELGASFGDSRGEAGRRFVERAAGFAAQRGDSRHLRGQRRHPCGQRVATLGETGNMSQMLLLALGDSLVERRQACRQGRGCLAFALLGLSLAFGDVLGERLRAIHHDLFDPFGLLAERLKPFTGIIQGVGIDLGDLADGVTQALLEFVDGVGPAPGGVVLRRAQQFGDLQAFRSGHADAFAQESDFLFGAALDFGMARFEFFAQPVSATAQRGEGFDFMTVEFGAKLAAALAEHCKARAGDVFEMVGLGIEGCQRVVNSRAQRGDLAFARLAKLIEPIEAADQLLELALGGIAGLADLAGDVARGVGDHRQFAAQPVHVVERGRADAADRLDLFAVVADQALQRVGVLRNPLAGDAAEQFEVARLGGDEIARQAELAVDHCQAFFKSCAFQRQRPRNVGKARCFAARMPQRQQPQRNDEQHRHGPGDDPGAPLVRRAAGKDLALVRPAEEPGPAEDRQNGEGGHDPAPLARCRFVLPNLVDGFVEN